MALLTSMPSQAIIAGYKGKLDFYYWRGLPCCRSWPKSPGKNRAPAVRSQWPIFTVAAREWANLSPEVQAAYNKMAERSGLCGRDLQIRSYLSGLYRWDVPDGD